MEHRILILSLCVLTLFSLIKGDDQVINLLLRQAIAQQDYVEEFARMEGASGVRGIRSSTSGGTRPYHYATHASRSMIAIHNHPNFVRTIGMGELDVVLNGVQFRTRHNDYKLVMPHRITSGFKETEDIPFPEVPPEVLQKSTVQGQVEEMREYFRAFKAQDTNIRNYKPYFKPVLCYLEGAWTTTKKDIDEPFDSDRHFIDAKNWLDLQEKVAFTSYTGAKSESENFAYLPTRITELVNGTKPLIAQWNYRIRCAPVKFNKDDGLNLNRFRLVDDLATQLSQDKTAEEIANSRAARYSLDYWPTNKKEGRKWERSYAKGILDDLMYQIPGYDNYPANLRDDAFGSLALQFNGETLNSARYHRRFKKARLDAMGSSARRRGFADPNVFMAQNTRPNVPGAKYQSCKTSNGVETCTEFRQRWSWAIPLEIIYLTPLLTWNPYNLQFHGKEDQRKVTMGGRDGGLTPDKAFNGNSFRSFFLTPKEFFTDEADSDSADTGGNVVGVLDPTGTVRQVRSSGTRVFIPEISGIGTIRTRYPIVPIYNDGNQMLKELEALKDIVLKMQQYSNILKESPTAFGEGQTGDGTIPSKTTSAPLPNHIELAIDETHKDPPGVHTHMFTLTSEDIQTLMTRRGRVTVETSQGGGHTHTLKLGIVRNRLKIVKCDGRDRCWDRHPAFVSAADEFITKIKGN